MTRGAVFAALALALTGGCARLVVVDREATSQLNDTAWTIRSAPPKAVVAVPSDLVIAKADDDEPAAPTVAVDRPAPAAPIVPLPTAAPPVAAAAAVPAAALASPPDEYGIPRDLYRHDPLLAAQSDIMATRVSSHRKMGAGSIVAGCVMGGLAAVLFWRASVNAAAAERARDQGQEVTDPSGQQAAYGIVDSAFALGFIIYGISDLATAGDPTALQRYYRETYGPR